MSKAKTEAERVRKKRRIIILTPIVVVGVIAAIFVPRYLYEHRTIGSIPEPIQIDIADAGVAETSKTITGDGFRVRMNYLATYDIKGLVVTLDDYDTKRNPTSFDKAIPRDLSLAWGIAAANADKIEWRHAERALRYEMRDTKLFQATKSSISNNHIIVEEGELRQKLKKVRKGDYIEMKGYLVSGEVDDGNDGEAYSFHSSLVRTDHMEHVFGNRTSCEIIYLTDLEWLD